MTLSSPPSPSYNTVLQVVESWPPADQIAFAETILQRAHQRVQTTRYETPVTTPSVGTPSGTPTSAPRRDTATTTALHPPHPQRPSWRDLVGAAALPGQEPPTDAQVAQWLEERREERYGG